MSGTCITVSSEHNTRQRPHVSCILKNKKQTKVMKKVIFMTHLWCLVAALHWGENGLCGYCVMHSSS